MLAKPLPVERFRVVLASEGVRRRPSAGYYTAYAVIEKNGSPQ